MCKRSNALSLPVLIARSNLIALIFNARFCGTSVVATTDDGRQRTDEKDRLARKSETELETLFRPPSSVFRHPSFAGLVVLAGSLYPIPSRTRPLNSPAPMVLSLKAWKSRSLPGLPRTDNLDTMIDIYERPP